MYRLPEINFDEPGKLDGIYPHLLFGDDIVMSFQKHKKFDNKDATVLRAIYYTSDSVQTAYNILRNIKDKTDELILIPEDENSEETKIRYSLVYTDETGSYEDSTKSVMVPRIKLDQFNEDLPDSKIQEALKDPKGGIFIFHGEPGCGKTSYIKYLIQTNKDKQFSYLGVDMLGNSAKLREYVISRQQDDLIIIVEDCEVVLQSRSYGGGNPTLSDILNISNGLIGDMTNTKFIFTFNNSLSTIDPALLRKCRLRYRYEFGPLKGKNLENLATKLGLKLKKEELDSGLSLSDLFGYNTEVEVEEQQTRRIGFR